MRSSFGPGGADRLDAVAQIGRRQTHHFVTIGDQDSSDAQQRIEMA
jgi:hypothetical protein